MSNRTLLALLAACLAAPAPARAQTAAPKPAPIDAALLRRVSDHIFEQSGGFAAENTCLTAPKPAGQSGRTVIACLEVAAVPRGGDHPAVDAVMNVRYGKLTLIEQTWTKKAAPGDPDAYEVEQLVLETTPEGLLEMIFVSDKLPAREGQDLPEQLNGNLGSPMDPVSQQIWRALAEKALTLRPRIRA